MHLQTGTEYVRDNCPERAVQAMGAWNERWRYKQLLCEDWKPRTRALGRDPLTDPLTLLGVDPQSKMFEYIDRNHGFPEVPEEVTEFDRWNTVLMGQWREKHEHVTKSKGALDDRHKCETLHQDRETATADEPIVATSHGVLSLVAQAHGERTPPQAP